MPDISSSNAILADGLSLVGFGEERQQCGKELSVKIFRAHYGIGPRSIKALIADLKRYQPDNELDVKSLFMAISWIRLYGTEEVMAGRWGYGKKNCRERVRDYELCIGALKQMRITFKSLDPKCKFAPVDIMHSRTEEFRCDPSSI